jgi:hypothetical protein
MILSLLLTGCGIVPGTSCTLMYMESGLSVELDGDLPDGIYIVEVIEDGEPPLQCQFEISEVPTAELCEGARVEFDADGTPTLRITPDLPEDIEVVLWQDDDELASETFSGIEYGETEYNGRGCDVAYNAQVTLAL